MKSSAPERLKPFIETTTSPGRIPASRAGASSSTCTTATAPLSVWQSTMSMPIQGRSSAKAGCGIKTAKRHSSAAIRQWPRRGYGTRQMAHQCPVIVLKHRPLAVGLRKARLILAEGFVWGVHPTSALSMCAHASRRLVDPSKLAGCRKHGVERGIPLVDPRGCAVRRERRDSNIQVVGAAAPRHPAPPGPPGSRPAHADERPHPQRPEEDRGQVAEKVSRKD